MEARAERVSEVVEFRSMAVVGEDRALTQVKGVDGLYPLEGEVELDPPFPLEEALADRGLPGAVMDRVLADRLGLSVGESFRLGTRNFRLGAVLVREPDSITGGFSFGPRTLVHSSALTSSGLLEPGTLYETEYRLDLPAGTDLAAAQAEAEAAFRDKGMRWSDSRRASPGVERFVDRTGSFLVLVGLAGLAVGGVGISAAVRAYLEGEGRHHRHAPHARGRGAHDLSGLSVPDRRADRARRGGRASAGRPSAARGLALHRGLPALPGDLRDLSGTSARSRLLRHPHRLHLHALAARPRRERPRRRALPRHGRRRSAALALARRHRRADGAPRGRRRGLFRHGASGAGLGRRYRGRAPHPSRWPRSFCEGQPAARPAPASPAAGRRCASRWPPSAVRGRRRPRSSCRWASAFLCWPRWARSTPTSARPSSATCRRARPPTSSWTSSRTRSRGSSRPCAAMRR